MANVFISYAQSDAPQVERIMTELRRRGIVGQDDHLLDPAKSIPGGTILRDAIRNQIAAASKVVVLWGPAASASANVNYEAGMADALDKPIVLVVPAGEQSRPRVDAREMQVVEVGNDPRNGSG